MTQPLAIGPSIAADAVPRRRVVVVTGMSGAGKSTALKALEDAGYESVDNLPLSLIAPLIRGEDKPDRPIAIGVDIRTRDFGVAPFLAAFDQLSAEGALDLRLLFLDSDDEALRRRFSETRRRHPLAADRPVTDGIAHERSLLLGLRDRADWVIDTSTLAAAELRRLVQEQCGLDRAALAVSVVSFAFRHGLPREADLVFDVRFLDNPHYRPELRPLSGRNERVGAFIARDPAYAPFFGSLTAMIEPLLPRFEAEGKSYLTIAVGCTGGQHRSVFVAEQLSAWLSGLGRRVNLVHRDLDRGGEGGCG